MATPPPPPFSIRPAVYAELPTLARISTLAFWNDVLFGQLIHPHREQYPEDNDLYWLRRMRVDWWDWSQIFLVAVQQEEGMEGEGGKRKEVLAGTAHWVRIAEPGENRRAGWGLRWGDVRQILHPVSSLLTTISSLYHPNRAASPAHESIIEASIPFTSHLWTASSPSWYLSSLAVLPSAQNRGIGRALVQWGLTQAEKEGVSASVVAAEGKEMFYQRCGFDEMVGRSGEGEGNPLGEVPGGEIYFKRPKAKVGD